MLQTSYTWRPLGELLVSDGALTPTELETALAQQRRTGRLVGEILVGSGYISAFALARALAGQHGVELSAERSPSAAPPSTRDTRPNAWRPLGKLLVEREFLTRAQLDDALAAQRAAGGRRLLGEILVGSGFLSGVALTHALAEQHGLQVDSSEGEHAETVLTAPAPGQPIYQVREVVYEPRYEARSILYETVSFLEATDFAAEFVEDNEPGGIEIQRAHGGTVETVWTYSASRASAVASSQKPLVETFGFDPMLWGAAR